MNPAEPIAELLAQAWQLAYLDPLRARDLGRQVVERTRHEPGSAEAGYGWLHIALAEVRLGDPDLASEATQHARAVFDRIGHPRGISLVVKLNALGLKGFGATIQKRGGIGRQVFAQ